MKNLNHKDAIRCFIAIDLPTEPKQKITHSYPTSKDKRVKWIPFSNLHLTIKFLDSLSVSTIKKIKNILGQIKFDLNLSIALHSLGVFPQKGYPRVLWISFQEKKEGKILSLFQTIEERLSVLDIPKEKRIFKPHITIARCRIYNNNDLQEFNRIKKEYEKKISPFFNEYYSIPGISLFQSQLLPTGAVYSKLWESPSS